MYIALRRRPAAMGTTMIRACAGGIILVLLTLGTESKRQNLPCFGSNSGMGVSPSLPGGTICVKQHRALRTSKMVGRSTVRFYLHCRVCLAVDLSRPNIIIPIWIKSQAART